jgi:aspartate/methionine/tyrosine aminotransferase
MSRLSETARGMRPGVFAELERHVAAHVARGGELITLHLGDTCLAPPTPPAPRHSDALAGDVHAALGRYGPTAGMPELRGALLERLERARGSLDGLDVLVSVGGTHALYCSARCALDPGDDVLVCAPCWPLAHGVFHQAGARCIEVPFTSRLYADPSLDAGDLLRDALTPKTRAIYVTTPNNPDGKVLSTTHLRQIARLADDRDLWVFADEVYCDATFEAQHVAMGSIPEAAGRTITVHSFSKSRALAGARVGFAVAPQPLVAVAQRMSVHTVFNVPLAMQRAALAVLGEDAWVARAREAYRSARDAAVRALDGAPVRFCTAEGGTYLFLDFTELLGGRTVNDLLARAIARGVMLAPGEAFGRAYARWARLCFTAVPEARVVDGIARLREAMDEMA